MKYTGKVTVVGAGFMGAVIATLYARYGYDVALHDTSSEALASFRSRAEPIAASLVTAGESPGAILDRVTPNADLADAVRGAFLVQETVQEDLAVKQDLFRRLDDLCRPEVYLATNTSSLMLSAICAGMKHPERALGIHFVTPAHIIRVVELIHAKFTSPETLAWGRAFVETIDHVGVACAERPGHLLIRIHFAILAEVFRIVADGTSTPEEIDAVFRLSLGPRYALWGPFLTDDLVVNKKTCLSIWQYLSEKTGETRFADESLLAGKVARGEVGAIAGKGWYEFGQDYATIVRTRDAQLKEIFDWLREREAWQAYGARPVV